MVGACKAGVNGRVVSVTEGVCMAGGHAWQGACMGGMGVHGWGRAWQGEGSHITHIYKKGNE